MSISKILKGIDHCEVDYMDGWWETASGAEFGRVKLVEAQAYEAGLLSRIEALTQELETERMRLVACGVAAMGNTETSKLERINKDNPYWSASYGDVCRAVDAEIELRGKIEALEKDTARLDWIIDNASSRGGGNGFTLQVFVPVDCECVRTAIDAAIAK